MPCDSLPVYHTGMPLLIARQVHFKRLEEPAAAPAVTLELLKNATYDEVLQRRAALRTCLAYGYGTAHVCGVGTARTWARHAAYCRGRPQTRPRGPSNLQQARPPADCVAECRPYAAAVARPAQVSAALAQALGLPDPAKLRFTKQNVYSGQPHKLAVKWRQVRRRRAGGRGPSVALAWRTPGNGRRSFFLSFFLSGVRAGPGGPRRRSARPSRAHFTQAPVRRTRGRALCAADGRKGASIVLLLLTYYCSMFDGRKGASTALTTKR